MTNQAQLLASQPEHSAWVLASAGTGKTKILLDRLLRLVLNGNDPKKILCITFTNAAANEIENRLETILQSYRKCTSKHLVSILTPLIGKKKAQYLSDNIEKFDELVNDVKNNFKAYTIHAFCQNLICKFPIEAKVSAGSKVIDTIQSDAILKLQKKILYTNKKPSIYKHLKLLLKYYSIEQIDKLISKALNISHKIFNLVQQDTSIYKKKLLDHFSCNANVNINSKINAYLGKIQTFNITINDNLSPQDINRLSILKKYLSLPKQKKREKWQILKSIFLNIDNSLKKNIISNKVKKLSPTEYRICINWQNSFFKLYNYFQLYSSFSIHYSLFIIIKKIYEDFTYYKKIKGFLDYNDLIHYAKYLLCYADQKEWVLYKLDSGYKHLLIDEAQDTSVDQWQIIVSLIENFLFTQDYNKNKTIFVVGDPKQSIYGFQGADIQNFVQIQKLIEDCVLEQTQKKVSIITLTHCYRSSQIILDFVYKTLSIVGKEGYFDLDNVPVNSAIKQTYSKIELIPLVPKKNNLLDNSVINLNKKDIAKIVAKYVQDILTKQAILCDQKKTIKESDIMILVQNRGILFTSIIQELEKLGLKTNFLEKPIMQNHIVIQDIICLAKFILFPFDNFNTTCLLKSFFFNKKDAFLNHILLDLQDKDPNVSLIDYLSDKSLNNQEAQQIAEQLSSFLHIYETKDLFSFFYIVCQKLKNHITTKQSFHIIDKFLDVILKNKSIYENSLLCFIKWFEQNPIEISKHNIEEGVKILTVHAAKGLESPIVIIPDASQMNLSNDDIVIENNLCLFTKHIFCKNTNKINKQIQESNYAEYLRLMYVAFTRAKNCLLIFGQEKNNTYSLNNWYDIALAAIKNVATTVASPILQNFNLVTDTFVYQNQDPQFANKETIENLPSSDNKNLHTNLSALEIKMLQLYKSDSRKNSTQQITNQDIQFSIVNFKNRIDYGSYTHKLIERSLNGENLKTLYKSNLFKQLPLDKKQQLKKFLSSQLYKKIKQPDNIYTEIPVYKSDDKTVLRIDLLIVRGKNIDIIDYKTDQKSVHKLEDLNEKYLNQLAQYKTVITNIYKNYHVSAYILWISDCSYLKIL